MKCWIRPCIQTLNASAHTTSGPSEILRGDERSEFRGCARRWRSVQTATATRTQCTLHCGECILVFIPSARILFLSHARASTHMRVHTHTHIFIFDTFGKRRKRRKRKRKRKEKEKEKTWTIGPRGFVPRTCTIDSCRHSTLVHKKICKRWSLIPYVTPCTLDV